MAKRDLVIIGGGVGGLIVASIAGQLGLKVTLIEKEASLGGDCLHHGCVPSKTLIHSAKVGSLMRRAADFGLPPVQPDTDLGRVMGHVHAVIAEIQKHDDPERFRGYGVQVLFGTPRFVDAHRIEVNEQVIKARRFVIATGSGPLVPPIEGIDTVNYWTNRTVFDQQVLPGRLTVLGGGPIGVELAQSFARLGSEVTVVEALRLLPQEDEDISAALQDCLQGEGLTILTGTTGEAVRHANGTPGLVCNGGNGSTQVSFDALLVALGRRPNVLDLGLEQAGVEYDKAKGIPVDARLRTSQKHIFACGDVCGPYPFTHMAEYQAGIVISNAVFRFPKKVDYAVVPWVTFSDPEVARVGLNEQQAREQGVDYELLRFDFKEVDRSLAEVEPHGFAKLLVKKNKILGATIIGPHAGELLHEVVLAMQAGLDIGKISAAVHVYPTLAQILRRAVNTHYAPKLYAPRTRRIVKTINRLVP